MLWEISWQNLTMLFATIPTYEPEEETDGKKKPIAKAEEVDDLTELKDFLEDG